MWNRLALGSFEVLNIKEEKDLQINTWRKSLHRGNLSKPLTRSMQKWKENNKLQVRADTKARRRKHRDATPKWLSRRQKSEIRQLYQIAITMTQTTGEQYVVDHIVPLRGEAVCGLHVPWNLQHLPAAENIAKKNASDDWGGAA